MSTKNLGQGQVSEESKKQTDLSLEESEQKTEKVKEATNQELKDEDLGQVAGGVFNWQNGCPY